jgi:hypothetical protein
MKLRADVVKVLEDWKAGKPVRSLELGHVHRMKENPGSSPLIDITEHHHQDQERAHAYLFHLFELFQLNGVPATHEAFMSACDDYELAFHDAHDLTAEERDGAESLAWKALLFGWLRATEGHKDANYINVTRPQVQESAT